MPILPFFFRTQAAAAQPAPPTATEPPRLPARYRLSVYRHLEKKVANFHDDVVLWSKTTNDPYALGLWLAGMTTTGNPISEERQRRAPDEPNLTPNAFMRPDHSVALLKFLETEHLWVSVRDTGPLSRDRLYEKYACKPHEILDKSLKAKALNAQLDKVKPLQARLNDPAKAFGPIEFKYAVPKGYTGPPITGDRYPPLGNETFTQVKEARTFFNHLLTQIANAGADMADGKPLAKCNGLIGWWATVSAVLDGQEYGFQVPVGVLRVGAVDARNHGLAVRDAGVPVPFGAIEAHGGRVPVDGYTGDYDLHDVFRENGEQLAGYGAHPPEHAAAETQAVARGAIQEIQTFVDALMSQTGMIRKRAAPRNLADDFGDAGPDVDDRYASVIQHGPQAYYSRYLNAHNDQIHADLAKLGNWWNRDRKQRKSLKENFEKPVIQLFSFDGDGIALYGPPQKEGDIYVQTVYVMLSREEVGHMFSRLGLNQTPWSRGRGLDEWVVGNLPVEVWGALTSQLGAGKQMPPVRADILDFQGDNAIVRTEYQAASATSAKTIVTLYLKKVDAKLGPLVLSWGKAPKGKASTDYYKKKNHEYRIEAAAPGA